MQPNIAHKVDEVLKEKGIDIGYDPVSQTCKTWYKLKLKVKYRALGKLSNAKFWKRELNIDTNKLWSNFPETIEGVTATLLHEKTHLDIAPIETPAAFVGLYHLYRSIDSPIKAAVVTIAAAFAYSWVIREFIVEWINYAKYGLNILNCKK